MPLGALSDSQTVVQVINPASQGASTVTSSYVSAAQFRRIQAIVNVGAMTATSTINASIVQATDSSGTGAKALSPAIAIVQLADTNSNKQFVLNARGDQLDVNNAFAFYALRIVVATAASIVSAVILGDPSATPPTPNASVVQVIQ